MKSVTAALREAFRRVGLRSDFNCYSDPRNPANLSPGYKAVGVKIDSLKFDPFINQRISNEMQTMGYHFHYARPVHDCWGGTRFCFSAPETLEAVVAID